MQRMGFDEALAVLTHGDDDTPLVELMEAIAIVSTNPTATLDQIALGLRHPEVVRESAAIALHVRTNRPEGPHGLILDEADWRDWLSSNAHAIASLNGNDDAR